MLICYVKAQIIRGLAVFVAVSTNISTACKDTSDTQTKKVAVIIIFNV